MQNLNIKNKRVKNSGGLKLDIQGQHSFQITILHKNRIQAKERVTTIGLKGLWE